MPIRGTGMQAAAMKLLILTTYKHQCTPSDRIFSSKLGMILVHFFAMGRDMRQRLSPSAAPCCGSRIPFSAPHDFTILFVCA